MSPLSNMRLIGYPVNAKRFADTASQHHHSRRRGQHHVASHTSLNRTVWLHGYRRRHRPFCDELDSGKPVRCQPDVAPGFNRFWLRVSQTTGMSSVSCSVHSTQYGLYTPGIRREELSRTRLFIWQNIKI